MFIVAAEPAPPIVCASNVDALDTSLLQFYNTPTKGAVIHRSTVSD